MSLAEDEETQRRGLVSVLYQVGDSPPSYDFELLRREVTFVRGLPIRIVAIHFCASTQLWMQVVDLAIHMASPFMRFRIRCHYGKDEDLTVRAILKRISKSLLFTSSETFRS